MENSVAKTFMAALQKSEQMMDPAPVAAFFHEGAELSNLRSEQAEHNHEGAHKFWQDYLSVFQRIHSDFIHVIETENAATLEWISEGVLQTGEPLRYKGVSILETEGDKVTKFRTYYDSAVFLPQGAKHKAQA